MAELTDRITYPSLPVKEEAVVSKVAEFMETLDQVKRYNALARSLKMSSLIITASSLCDWHPCPGTPSSSHDNRAVPSISAPYPTDHRLGRHNRRHHIYGEEDQLGPTGRVERRAISGFPFSIEDALGA